MTGFGKASCSIGEQTVTVEIKSLNSQKGLDLNMKLPGRYREYEYLFRTQTATPLQRGKIDVYVSIEQNTGSGNLSLNKKMIKTYYNELKSIADEVGASCENLFSSILKMDNIAEETSSASDEDEYKQVETLLAKAINEVDLFRQHEGQSLEKELQLRIANIENFSAELENEDSRRINEVRQRLQNNLENFIPKDKIDTNRFEQEVIYYLEKLDITEELTRLKSHSAYFKKCIADSEEQKGRKLNFISQEIGREINTVGSKANDATMQKLVVNMKDELEKIKEQTNNIL